MGTVKQSPAKESKNPDPALGDNEGDSAPPSSVEPRLLALEVSMKSISETLSAMNQKLERLCPAEPAALAEEIGSEDGNDQDRKRMKERLKETLELDKKRFHQEPEREGWLEYVFGICQADGRVGKARSR